MNMLQGLPCAIEVDGRFYTISANYRTVLEWFQLYDDERLTKAEKAHATVLFFCKDVPLNWESAFVQIIRFVCLGEEPTEGYEEKVTDFRQDFKYIWSGFRKVYGIDLLKEDLHWWEFRMLLDELPDDCVYKQIVAIRSQPINIENPQQAFKIMELKEKYALKG